MKNINSKKKKFFNLNFLTKRRQNVKLCNILSENYRNYNKKQLFRIIPVQVLFTNYTNDRSINSSENVHLMKFAMTPINRVLSKIKMRHYISFHIYKPFNNCLYSPVGVCESEIRIIKLKNIYVSCRIRAPNLQY